MKNLVIKTASVTIYVANGKVTLVRCNKTGRFVAIKKFANIVNMLVVKAKNVDVAKKSNHDFYFNNVTRLAIKAFNNAVKMATALLGSVRVFTSRNYCHDAFNHTVLSLYA